MKHGLQQQLFAQVVGMLIERGLILKKSTVVDSTIISTPSSAKNEEKTGDPDAYQTKKGNNWYLGYKADIGVNRDSGIIHTVKVTETKVTDLNMTSELIHREEETLN